MDPITTTMLADPLGRGGIRSDRGRRQGRLEGLKAVIRRKWGETAPISRAITALEENPGSKAQAAVLEEKVAVVKATADAGNGSGAA
jgi:hypothetical protein